MNGRSDGGFAVGDLVQTMFDTGAFGAAVLYGEVIASGPKCYRVRWESGLTNRLPQGYFDVKPASNAALAKTVIARATEPQA